MQILLALLVLFWLLGYIHIPWLTIPRFPIFEFNGRVISFYDIIIFILIIWAIGILPTPFRQIASALVVLWVLSLLGIIAIAGLSNLLVIAIIVGVLISLFRR